MPPSATSPSGTPRARSGPFGLDCSAAMKSATVVHCRPVKLRQGGVWALNELTTALIYSGASREVSAGRPIADGCCQILGDLRRGREAFSEWAAPKSKGAARTAPFVA